ncbi:MAG: SDR family oxidoreductase [Phycisphaerae bacterium]
MRFDWLFTGAGGQFGSVLLRELLRRGESVLGLRSPRGPKPAEGLTVAIDITDRAEMARAVRTARPHTIVHAAAVTNVTTAFEQPGLAQRTNVAATEHLVELAAELNARLVYLSTDMVFDGTAAPYSESDPPAPLSVYGRTKAEAEWCVGAYDHGLIVRPPLMYGQPCAPRETTFLKQLDSIRQGRPLRLFEDEYRSPIDLGDAARACLAAARSDLSGILHIAGPQRLSRLEMGRIMAKALGRSDACIIPVRRGDVAFPEPRPADLCLACDRYTGTFGKAPGRPMEVVLREIAAALGRA